MARAGKKLKKIDLIEDSDEEFEELVPEKNVAY
jgi:hypothetical protein